MSRPARLFELLVVGGGLLLGASATGCGGVEDPLTTTTTTTSSPPRTRTLADGGVSDAGIDTGDPGGTGSGFW
ncbi:MAG: hypothetical protein U0228_09795 [Myxococcaceae bacterium]